MSRPSPAPRSDSPEHDFVRCIPQLCERTDSAAASSISANEYEVDYNLLQLPEPSYPVESRPAGMCGVITEKLIQERKEGDTFIFVGLNRILVLTVLDKKTFVASLGPAHWLMSYEKLQRTMFSKREHRQ